MPAYDAGGRANADDLGSKMGLKMKKAVLLALATLLSACGQDDQPASTAAPETKIDVEQSANADGPADAAPEVEGLIPEAEVQDIGLFNAMLLMTPEEVTSALVTAGFEKPTNVNPFEGQGWGDVGLDCENARGGCFPGKTQSSAYYFNRGADLRGSGFAENRIKDGFEEQILPFFFVDKDGVQRLHELKYERRYVEAIAPDNIADGLVTRFGAPRERRVLGTDRTLLYYSIIAPMPSGFEDQNLNNLRNRRRCLYDIIEEIQKPSIENCQYIHERDFDETAVLFAEGINCGFEIGCEAPQAIFADITPHIMELTVQAHYLADIEKARHRVSGYLDEIAALRERLAKGETGVADDL